jgi:hypothetical protein
MHHSLRKRLKTGSIVTKVSGWADDGARSREVIGFGLSGAGLQDFFVCLMTPSSSLLHKIWLTSIHP